MERVLITGATGFLGGRLARYLRDTGREVIATGRSPTLCAALQTDDFDTLCIDLSCPIPGDFAAKIGQVDAVVHCAALSAPWGRCAAFQAANVTGTKNVLNLATSLGARRFVNISSPTVYFALKDQIEVAETHRLPSPINEYAWSKVEAEKLVLARPELGPVNLRPRGIYGAGEKTLLPRLLNVARRGPLPQLRGGRAAIDLTHVSDVLTAIEAALVADEQITGETFNISGGEMTLVREIVERVCSFHSVPVRWCRLPLNPLLGFARLSQAISLINPGGHEPAITPYALGLFAFQQSLDINKAGQKLGWKPAVTLADGLEMTLTQETLL